MISHYQMSPRSYRRKVKHAISIPKRLDDHLLSPSHTRLHGLHDSERLGALVPLVGVGRDPEKGGDAQKQAGDNAVERKALNDRVGKDGLVRLLVSSRLVGHEVSATCRAHLY